jgi:hypothetical protein
MTGATSTTRTVSPFAYIAYGMAFAGALLLVLAPFLPLAYVEVLGESVEVEPGLGSAGWGVVLCGVAAAALAGVAIVRRNPLWVTGVALVGLVAMVWSGWYAFVKLPDAARFADSASLGWGGITFVTAGPVLLIAATAAFIASRSWTIR